MGEGDDASDHFQRHIRAVLPQTTASLAKRRGAAETGERRLEQVLKFRVDPLGSQPDFEL